MRQLFDYRCEDCGLVTERYIDDSLRITECECGGKATRIMATPNISLEGLTGSFPSAYHKWADIREDNARIKAKRAEAA